MMKTPSILFLLLLGLSGFDARVKEVKRDPKEVTQDTTSVSTWKRKAEESEQYARMQKKLAEKMAAEIAVLKKKLEECERTRKN